MSAAFLHSLVVMGIGMLGIFLVLGVIFLVVVLLGRIFPGGGKEKSARAVARAAKKAEKAEK